MERLDEAMSFIERHLEGDVDIRRASRIATMSEHHFRRVFSTLAGMSLSEYVRRRRMTLAAASVLTGEEAVQDLAVRSDTAPPMPSPEPSSRCTVSVPRALAVRGSCSGRSRGSPSPSRSKGAPS